MTTVMPDNITEDIQDEELKKAVTRAFDLEEGKVVLVDFGNGIAIRSDYECKDKGTDACNDCRLRFGCYSNQYLIIDAKNLNLSLDHTINELVEDYIEAHKHNG